MFRRENCVLVVGEENILHQGFFYLIERECLLGAKKTIFAENVRQLAHRQVHSQQGHYALSVLCLSHQNFFPEWLSLLVKVTLDANGRVLIFSDKCELLTSQRKRLIERVIDLEVIFHPALPPAYISHVIHMNMDKSYSGRMRCRLSVREMSILDGFTRGISAASQASFFGISLKTLYQHRKNCANKLGLRNLKELLHM